MSGRRFGGSRFAVVSTPILLAAVACSTAPASSGDADAAADGTRDGGSPDAGKDQVLDASADTSFPADAADASPAHACMTHYLDPAKYLAGLADPAWYVANIP